MTLLARSLVMSFTLLLLSGLALSGLYVPVTAAPPMPSASQMQQLKKGQVLVWETGQSKQDPNALKGMMATILIEKPLDTVWNLVTNQPRLFAGDPQMKTVKVLKKQSTTAEMVAYTLAISKFLPTFNYTNQVTYYPKKQVNFERVSGSFKKMSGRAYVSPMDGGKSTLLQYQLSIDPGMMIPGFVINNILKNDMPRMLTDIEKRAKSL